MDADNEKRKKVVLAFYEAALNRRDYDVAVEYVGAHYRQHNPLVEDDRAGLRKYLVWIQENFPKSRGEILCVFVDRDYVLLHVHRIRTPDTLGDAVVDIFHVIQQIPETSANANTMF